MSDTAADNTTGKQSNLIPFKPGQSGNPAGRPKGAKSRLQEDFLKDVQQAWEARGSTAIQDMIEQKPHEFVKMVAGLMPKEMTLNMGDAYSEMTDDELIDRLAQLQTTIAPYLAGGTGAVEDGAGIAGSKAITSQVH